jgi:long-chain acyl-CoA synthetase
MPQNLKSLVPQAKCVNRGPFTVEAPGYEKVEGETIPRRNVKSKDKLRTRPVDEIATIPDILKYAANKFGNAKLAGTRKLIKMHEEVKKVKKMVDGVQTETDKKWSYFEMGEFKFISFVEFEQLALSLGSGLRKLGLQTADRVHLYAPTWSVLPSHFVFALGLRICVYRNKLLTLQQRSLACHGTR